MKKVVFLVFAIMVLTSCASAPPKYSGSDVARADTREDQLALYRSLESEIAASTSKSDKAEYRQLLNQLGPKLGRSEASRIRQNLQQSKLASGHVPLSVINAGDSEAQPIQKWSPAEFSSISTELEQLRSATTNAINNETAQLDQPSGDNPLVDYVQGLGRIAELYGDDPQANMAYQVAMEDAQEQIRSIGDQAFRGGDYYTAMRNYQDLQRLDPDYPGIDQLLSSTQTGLESADFRELLIDGDVEGAYAAFNNLSQQPMSQEQKAAFFGSADSLAQYFAGSADDSLRSRSYRNAYIYIKREMAIRAWMGEPSQVSTSTTSRFTDAMFELADASNAVERPGLEYGYLLLVEEFNPSYATLENRKREASEIIYDHAIRRVGSVSIDSPDPSDQQVASQISAGVRHYLMDNIPADVKIVERAKLDQIRRERTMSESHDDSELSRLESADFLIEGELLKAEVVSEVNKVRNRKRVVTGQTEETNPAFEAWIREKGKRKADHPDAPPKTVMVPVKEDIELNYEEHRKFGEVGVTYWVIDTTSAEHLHSASASKNMRVTDESREGVQIGAFVQEAKLPDLPSELEIYNELVDEVVEEMAADLVDFLANPEGDYYESCKTHAAENENLEAAEQCAKAAVLREFKALNNEEVVVSLKEVTLGSNMRRD
jgi:hypothetical protein